MNNQRRKELDKAFDLLAEAKDIIEAIVNDEQEAFDNMPESLQDGEKGERMQDAILSMESAVDQIDEAMSEIETAKE